MISFLMVTKHNHKKINEPWEKKKKNTKGFNIYQLQSTGITFFHKLKQLFVSGKVMAAKMSKMQLSVFTRFKQSYSVEY